MMRLARIIAPIVVLAIVSGLSYLSPGGPADASDQGYMSNTSPWAKNAARPAPVIEDIPLYGNCDAARAAGAAPLYYGQPGYRSDMDGDGDGVACEPYYGR